MSDELIWDATDPLGNIIILEVSTWNYHIALRHPEVSELKDATKTTVEKPETIYKDKKYNKRNCYRSVHGDSTLNPYGKYLKVVVDLSGESNKVKTAYLTDIPDELSYKIYPNDTDIENRL